MIASTLPEFRGSRSGICDRPAEEPPAYPSCSQNAHGERDGTTPMSAFCSRNAHDRNVLVRRPQSGLTRVPFQRRVNEQAWREHLYRSMRAVKGGLGHSPKERYWELKEPRWMCAFENRPGCPIGRDRGPGKDHRLRWVLSTGILPRHLGIILGSALKMGPATF